MKLSRCEAVILSSFNAAEDEISQIDLSLTFQNHEHVSFLWLQHRRID